MREESEREIRDLKERNTFDGMQYNKEIQNLQTKAEDPTDKETIRRLHRENENLKSKVTEMGYEVEEVRKARDVISKEGHAAFLQTNRELEEERSLKRCISNEKDRLEVLLKDSSEQLTRFRGQYDLKMQENNSLKNEVDSLRASLETYTAQNEGYKSELGKIREELMRRETEIESKIREIIELEHEKVIKER
jgi:chromosome segregation ATPase